MVLIHQLLALPPALLGLVLEQSTLAQAKDLEWPYNLPAHVKYYPEDEDLVKRHGEIRQKLQEQRPLGMRKMSGDPGEMFFLHYWHFDLDGDHIENNDETYLNGSTSRQHNAPLKLHANPKSHRFSILPRVLRRTAFDKRDFECPADSSACTSIDRPNSCCGNGSTCQIVEDTGLGDVGCCPENQVCTGSVSECPADHTSCPQDPGGGCCVPGYACFDVGCVAVSTAIVTVVPTTTSIRSTSSSRSISSPTPPPAVPSTQTETETQTETQTETETQIQTTTIVPVPVPAPSTTSETITTSTESSSSRQNTLECSSGFRSCPASLGGGCCPTDRACGRDVCPEISSTNSFTAPARPTSNTIDGTTTSTATDPASVPPPGCPTGFYACSAFYQGGCCQTGRDCQETSCPPGGSITVVAGSSLTIDAPTGTGISSVGTLLTGSCASGWSTCATDAGGGCCPSGYACGMACTATATGGQENVVGKIAPNMAVSDRRGWRTRMGAVSSLLTVATLLGYFA